jgi:hypothetical protein
LVLWNRLINCLICVLVDQWSVIVTYSYFVYFVFFIIHSLILSFSLKIPSTSILFPPSICLYTNGNKKETKGCSSIEFSSFRNLFFTNINRISNGVCMWYSMALYFVVELSLSFFFASLIISLFRWEKDRIDDL